MPCSAAEWQSSNNTGTIQQSAEALSRLLITFATSACYPQLQLLRAKLFKSTDASLSSKPVDQSLGRPAAAKAEAVAADWVCLLWLLQKAPEEVTRGLKAEWQKGQVQEFATWVRPASELSAVRSKAAAKVCAPHTVYFMHHVHIRFAEGDSYFGVACVCCRLACLPNTEAISHCQQECQQTVVIRLLQCLAGVQGKRSYLTNSEMAVEHVVELRRSCAACLVPDTFRGLHFFLQAAACLIAKVPTSIEERAAAAHSTVCCCCDFQHMPMTQALHLQLMRQQLRELSITSQSRPSSSKPSMANLTIHIGHSPLSITSPNGPTALGQPKGGSHMPGLAPNKASPGAGSVQPSSPSRLWLGSTPPLHPTSPTRGAAGLISPVQRSGPSKGGLRWGRWGRSPHPSQVNSPHFQFSDPSRNWPEEMGSPVIQSSSPSRNWAGPEGNSLVQSTSPSRNWAGPGGNWGVQSSSPSRAWGAATPPVQSSAPSFLKGWLSKQRGHSVAEELAMEVLTCTRLALPVSVAMTATADMPVYAQQCHETCSCISTWVADAS